MAGDAELKPSAAAGEEERRRPFTQRFPDLTAFEHDVLYVTLPATVLSTGCLIAPSAAHRLRFHQGDREWLVESANMLLITDLLFDGPRVWIYSVLVWAAILGLWFGRPLSRRLRGL